MPGRIPGHSQRELERRFFAALTALVGGFAWGSEFTRRVARVETPTSNSEMISGMVG